MCNDYKKRMIAEYVELSERIAKLEKMLLQNSVDDLDFEFSCPLELLQKQLLHMEMYKACLAERLAIEVEPFNSHVDEVQS